MNRYIRVVLILAFVGVLVPASAHAVVITFETLSDLDSVTTQFPGLTFTNAVALTAGATLNEFEFPPKSGDTVVADDSGPLTIEFAELQPSVAGFFNYNLPITLTAFDDLNTPVASDTSDFSSNLGVTGDAGSSPNELLEVAFAAGIRRVMIEGSPTGDSFTLDNLTLISQVPVPATLLLLAPGLAAIAWRSVSRGRTRTST